MFDYERLYLGSELRSILLAGEDLTDWVRGSYREFANVMDNGKFPCTFARVAYAKDTLLFHFPGRADDRASLVRLKGAILEYLDRLRDLDKIAAAMTVLNVLFQPQAGSTSLLEYQAKFCGVMQGLHDIDDHPWPENVPKDPEDPAWSFCFGGVPLFVNLSCPAHRKRLSRNVGPSMALILNPRDSFDVIAGAHPKGDKIRHHIRSLIQEYDGQPAAPDLGSFGRESNREWHQYTLPDENVPRTDTCPLVIRPNG